MPPGISPLPRDRDRQWESNLSRQIPERHRWHHSTLLEESNTNFGQNLILWYVVFGTRFLPKDREPRAEIGIGDMPDFPMDYVGQLLSPLRWAPERWAGLPVTPEVPSATRSA